MMPHFACRFIWPACAMGLAAGMMSCALAFIPNRQAHELDQPELGEHWHDFRGTEAYRRLSVEDRGRLEQAHHDFVLLWGALDMYAEDHGGELPTSLETLTPRYLRELPKDAFATPESAAKAEGEQDLERASLKGWGYRFRGGSPGNRAWVLSSVGLQDFPYLSELGNVGLYVCRGTWISGFNPSMEEPAEESK